MMVAIRVLPVVMIILIVITTMVMGMIRKLNNKIKIKIT